MSNFENTEVSVPVIDVESNPSASTLVEQRFEDSSDSSSSSEESVGTSIKHPLITQGVFTVIPRAQTSVDASFNGLTIPVVVPLDPRISLTNYVGVTITGLATRDLLDPSILTKDPEETDSADELHKTKKNLSGDFVLKNNTVGLEHETLALEVDPASFTMFYMSAYGAMSNYFVPICIEHFLAGLSIPLDLAFCDFLHMIRS